MSEVAFLHRSNRLLQFEPIPDPKPPDLFFNGGDIAGADRSLGNADDYDLSFLTDGSPRLHIQNDGKIGIGTGLDALFYALEIKQAGGSGQLILRESGTNAWAFKLDASNVLNMLGFGTSPAFSVSLLSSEKFNINATRAAFFHPVKITDGTQGSGKFFGSDASGNGTWQMITTVGTISSGIWQGTPIADAYIASAATWNAKQNALTFGIANGNSVVIDDADAEPGDFAKFTASGLLGRSASEVKSDLSLNLVENTALSTWAGSANITTVGTLTNLTVSGTVSGATQLRLNAATGNTISLQVNSVETGFLNNNGLSLGGAGTPTSSVVLMTPSLFVNATNPVYIRTGGIGVGVSNPLGPLDLRVSSGNLNLYLYNTDSAPGHIYRWINLEAGGRFYDNITEGGAAKFYVGFQLFGNNDIWGVSGPASGYTGFFVNTTNQVGIGDWGSSGLTPHASAALEIKSTVRGFLPPRGTTTQMNAISSPAAGLIFYDTTVNKHYGWNGSSWNAFY